MMRMKSLAGLAIIGAAFAGCIEGGESSVIHHEPSGESALQTGGLQIGSRFLTTQDTPFGPVEKMPFGPEVIDIEGVPSRSAGVTGRFELPHGGSLNTPLQDRLVPLPLKHTDVHAQLTFHIGSVTVTQQYQNPFASKIEAVYVF